MKEGENERSEPGHLKSGGDDENGKWKMDNGKWKSLTTLITLITNTPITNYNIIYFALSLLNKRR